MALFLPIVISPSSMERVEMPWSARIVIMKKNATFWLTPMTRKLILTTVINYVANAISGKNVIGKAAPMANAKLTGQANGWCATVPAAITHMPRHLPARCLKHILYP